MTTPGGVPNLPAGALTPETMASRLQDMSTGAMRSRAAARMPASFHGSNGGDPGADLTPFGIITRIFAGFSSAVANADPGDINGPEDLPGMLLEFIESLPVIGQFVGLLEAIVGEYDGDDEILNAIQTIFQPLRKLVQLVAGKDVGFPTFEEVTAGWEQLHEALIAKINEQSGINLATLDDFIESLDDGRGIDLPHISDALADLVAAFDGVDWTTQGALLRLFGSLLKIPGTGTPTVQQLLAKAGQVFFGPILGHRISQVAVGAITDDRPNLLVSWDVAQSVADSEVWHADTDGFGVLGSVYTTANGSEIVLTAPFEVPVGEAQQLRLSWPARWTSLAGTGTLICLDLVTYDGEAVLPAVLPFVLAGAVTLDDSAVAGTSTWVELVGEWTVPTGVTGVKARMRIRPTATAGTVWADAQPVLRVVGDIEQSWVRNLIPDLSGISDWIQALVNRLLTSLGLDPDGPLLTRINALGDEISDWLDRTEDAAAELAEKLGLNEWHDWLTETWDDFVHALLTNPISVLGVIPQALVSGLELAMTTVNNIVQGIIDQIHNAFANLGAMLDVGNPLNTVIDAILGIFDTARGGSAKAIALEARIRALESASSAITMTFNGASTSSLPGGQYDVRRIGGGAGDIGFDGKGSAVWKPFGAGNRIVLARFKSDRLDVDNGHIQTVLSSNPQPYIFDDAYTYLLFRMSTDNDTMMRLRIGYDSIRLQAMVDDVITNIGPSAGVSPKAGNDLDIWFGNDTGGPRAFVVALKGETIIDTVDTAEVSQVGADFRDIGLGMETGNYLVFGQNRPAGLGVVTATEVV